MYEAFTTNVSQIYNIPGQRRIMTLGQEDRSPGGPLTAIDGTGDFKGVPGEGNPALATSKSITKNWGRTAFSILRFDPSFHLLR
jgi:hypothetical protein